MSDKKEIELKVLLFKEVKVESNFDEKKELELIELLNELHNNDLDEMTDWLIKPTQYFLGMSPIRFMALDSNNIQRIIRHLVDILHGEPMGR